MTVSSICSCIGKATRQRGVPTYGSEPIGSRMPFVLSSHEERANILDELLKLHRPQSCQGVQHIRECSTSGSAAHQGVQHIRECSTSGSAAHQGVQHIRECSTSWR